MTPRKRSHSATITPEIPQTDRKRPNLSTYLSSYDASHPILLSISPLRRQQYQVFLRNLRNAGAHVIDPNTGMNPKHCRDDSVIESLLVVTDNQIRAHEQVSKMSFICSDLSVVYVSPRWVTDVSATQQNLPVERYQCMQDRRQEEDKNKVIVSSSKVGKKMEHMIIRPVWCPLKSNDMDSMHCFLRSLPVYMCQRSTITQSLYPCPNKELSDIFSAIAEKRVLENAGGSAEAADIRARAYRKAAAAIKCVPFKITSTIQVQPLDTIGPSVLSVVEEYLSSGISVEMNMLQTNPRLCSLKELCSLYGVGVRTARKFHDTEGINSALELLKRVKAKPDAFSHALVKYMSYWGKFTPVNTSIATALKNFVEQIANDETEEDGSLHLRFTLCGGLRRGEKSGHDVDLLYCRRAERAHDHSSVLELLLDRLSSRGMVITRLKMVADTDRRGEVRFDHDKTNSTYEFGHDTFNGIAVFQGKVFRLDIIGIRDSQEFPFATIAWSGSTAFQRDLRLWNDREHGWVFNQHGLFHRDTGKRVELTPLPTSEMDVFRAMGLVYRPPFERSA